ncbi:MAG: DinB family protein [Nocardioidaceae bacterium]
MTWTAPPVTRPEGPLTAGERAMVEDFLAWQRATLLHKCTGLTGDQLAQRSIAYTGLSLLGLIRHLSKVERIWFRERFAGQPVERLYSTETWKDADFEDLHPKRAEADYGRFLEECRLADEAVADAALDDTFTLNGEPASLRMIYLHMIEEYARHNGHADLLREGIDGVTGE